MHRTVGCDRGWTLGVCILGVLLTGLLCPTAGRAQPFVVGHRSAVYYDPARANREIPTEIYYSSASAGDNVPVAAGRFPVVAFGHGHLITWSCHSNI